MNRPYNPPFKQSNPGGRYWCSLKDCPAVIKEKIDLKNAGGAYVEIDGYHYRAETSRDGNSIFIVQKSAAETQKPNTTQFRKFPQKRIEGFKIATFVQEVDLLIKQGFQPVKTQNGLQIGTLGTINEDKEMDVVTGVFMIRESE